MQLCEKLHYPFPNKLKNELTHLELSQWFDYFNIMSSDDVKYAIEEYFMPELDDLGKQWLKAFHNLKSKK